MSPARRDASVVTPPAGSRARRRVWNNAVIVACYVSAALVMLPLVLIITHLVAHGWQTFTPGFFVHMPKPVGEPGGGMANAIVGTMILVGIGTTIAVPIGVGTGIYLAEYG